MTPDRKYYKQNIIHEGTKKEKNPLVERPIMHKAFYMKGELNLDGLEELTKKNWEESDLIGLEELTKKNWKKLYPLVENKEKTERTLVYANPNVTAIISPNYATNYHEIDITLKNYSNENPQIIEGVKNIIEKSLNCKLNEKQNNLTDKLESN
jgi:hypothetical protein